MNNIEELHESVNDIYYQLDDGKIDLDSAVDILLRVCKHFIGEDIK
jgi:hypothetical protein